MPFGLAGNVVQFVQSTGELISETNAIPKTGSPASLPELRKLTETLIKQAESIQNCLATNAGTSTTLAQEDQVRLPISLISVHI